MRNPDEGPMPPGFHLLIAAQFVSALADNVLLIVTIEQVRLGIGSDPRIGTHFHYAGCGWGGSCLPKDVRALHRMAADAGVPLDMLEAVQQVNERQRRLLCERLVARLGDDLRGHAIAL